MAARSPAVIMLVGLQGSGKTTTTAKLALYLRKQGPAPAAGRRRRVPPRRHRPTGHAGQAARHPRLRRDRPTASRWTSAENAVQQRQAAAATSVVILDTAGRLHIDDAMMDEVAAIRMALQANEVILIADAMTGQDAVRVAEEFNARVPLTGLILTKMDGDATRRRGALDPRRHRHPDQVHLHRREDRRAGAVLPRPPGLAHPGHGRHALADRAGRGRPSTRTQARAMEQKLRTGGFDLEDFLQQLQQIKKMGPLSQIVEMIPGMRGADQGEPAWPARSTTRSSSAIEAIINSMTRAGAPQPDHPQRQPPPPHRHGQRHQRAGDQPAAQAVQRDAEDDEATLRGAHAPHAWGLGALRLLSGRLAW